MHFRFQVEMNESAVDCESFQTDTSTNGSINFGSIKNSDSNNDDTGDHNNVKDLNENRSIVATGTSNKIYDVTGISKNFSDVTKDNSSDDVTEDNSSDDINGNNTSNDVTSNNSTLNEGTDNSSTSNVIENKALDDVAGSVEKNVPEMKVEQQELETSEIWEPDVDQDVLSSIPSSLLHDPEDEDLNLMASFEQYLDTTVDYGDNHDSSKTNAIANCSSSNNLVDNSYSSYVGHFMEAAVANDSEDEFDLHDDFNMYNINQDYPDSDIESVIDKKDYEYVTNADDLDFDDEIADDCDLDDEIADETDLDDETAEECDDEDDIGFDSDYIYEEPLSSPCSSPTNDDLLQQDGRMKCSSCSFRTASKYNLTLHQDNCQVTWSKPWMCSVCKKGFKARAALYNHQLIHRGLKPHRCKGCDARFTTLGELTRHIKYRHTFDKRFKCHFCAYRCVEVSHLRRHMRCHTGERAFQCQHCSYQAADTFKLRRHILVHTGERPYPCTICGKRFNQSNSLKTHRLARHSGNKPVFYCDLCPAKFGRQRDVQHHQQKMHTSTPEPVGCTKCPTYFNTLYSLKVHKRSHRGEKCFRCHLCPYAAISVKLLQIHGYVHTDAKPFKCQICDKVFRHPLHLKRHTQIHHDLAGPPKAPKEKQLRCEKCPKLFRYSTNLKRHLEKCIGLRDKPIEKPHECPECLKRFSYRACLITHVHQHQQQQQPELRSKQDTTVEKDPLSLNGEARPASKTKLRRRQKVMTEPPESALSGSNPTLDKGNKKAASTKGRKLRPKDLKSAQNLFDSTSSEIHKTEYVFQGRSNDLQQMAVYLEDNAASSNSSAAENLTNEIILKNPLNISSCSAVSNLDESVGLDLDISTCHSETTRSSEIRSIELCDTDSSLLTDCDVNNFENEASQSDIINPIQTTDIQALFGVISLSLFQQKICNNRDSGKDNNRYRDEDDGSSSEAENAEDAVAESDIWKTAEERAKQKRVDILTCFGFLNEVL